jgi:hypothetical protein
MTEIDTDTGRALKWATPNPPDWLRALCSGSTTDARKLTVVAEGEHLAVVKYPGGAYWGGSLSGRTYAPVHYRCVEKHPRESYRRGVTVREIQGFEGRQSKVAIEVFVTAMRALDSRWEDREAKRKAKEDAENDARVAKDREAEAQEKRDRLWLKHRAEVVAAAVALVEALGTFDSYDGPEVADLRAALKKSGHDYGDGKVRS